MSADSSPSPTPPENSQTISVGALEFLNIEIEHAKRTGRPVEISVDTARRLRNYLQSLEEMSNSSTPESVSGEERIRAYTPGSWGELPLHGRHVAVVLNDYHIRNLRWLLRHAWHGHAPENLNTGDWCGEILWALEQAMLDCGLTGQSARANGPDGGWPVDGYQVAFQSKLRAHLEIAESPDV